MGIVDPDPPFRNSGSGSSDPPLEIVDPAAGNYVSLMIFIHDLHHCILNFANA